MPKDSLLEVDIDKEKYPGVKGGLIEDVLDGNKQEVYLYHKKLLDNFIINPIVEGNSSYESISKWLNSKTNKQFSDFKGMDMTNLQLVNSVISDVSVNHPDVGSYLQDYYEDFMGKVVIKNFGKENVDSYTISRDYSDQEMVGMITELDSLQAELTELMSTPNSKGELQEKVMHPDGYLLQAPKSAYHETIHNYKSLKTESEALHEEYIENKKLYDQHLAVFDEATNLPLDGIHQSSLANFLKPSFWGDEKLSGYDKLKGVMYDFASVFASPMHIFDAVEEIWGGEDLYNSDMWQYNPLTNDFGPSKPLEEYKKKAEDSLRNYQQHYQDNYEAIAISGKEVLDKSKRYDDLRGIIEDSGYDELLEYMDTEEIMNILNKKRPIK